MSTDFQGRDLPPSPFSGDEGACPPALAAALTALAQLDGDAGAAALDAAEVALVDALMEARLIIAVEPVAAPGEPVDEAGARTEMATITLTSPEGDSAFPVFSSVPALARWRPGARPMPVASGDAARGAVQEGCQVMVLDIGGVETTLRPSMVWALATRHPWRPAHLDEQVARTVAQACAPEETVAWQELRRGSAGGLVVELGLRPGLDLPAVQVVCRRIAERIAADGETRARIDALEMGLRKA